MRYVKSQKTYKASNVYLIVDTADNRIVAYSYDWWKFVDIYNGKLIFNNHRYSSSTQRQQAKVQAVLDRLGIKIDHYVDSRESLGSDWKADAISRLRSQIIELREQVNAPRSHKVKNNAREKLIDKLRGKINEIESI